MPALARRLARIKPSATMAVTARAAGMIARGEDVLSLAAGEPDFDTPIGIAEAGIAAIRSGHTRYTAVGGVDALKDAVIDKFQRENGLAYGRAQVMVSSGAKQVLYNLCMALLDPGDEAIIPAPGWVSYADIVRLADAEPVRPWCDVAQGYKLTPAQLAASITAATRLVLLNSPCNPTGAAYSRAQLQALGEVLRAHPRIIIGTDDIYEHIYWGEEPFCSFAAAVPELHDRTVTINGCSKAFAMTGWRIGYCGGPAEIVQAMATLQGQCTSSATTPSQMAAVEALRNGGAAVTAMNAAYRTRHALFTAGLNAIPGFSCLPGVGTFYAFVDVRGAMQARACADDVAFTELLLTEGGVAGVPGSAFGAPGHLRLSYACSMDVLGRALERLDRVARGRGPLP